jgi:acylphosphatase
MAITIRRYRVEGAVQGVGFRWFVRERARVLDLSGYVCNDPDGAVIVVAAGESAALADLEGCLRVGPQHASVAQLVSRDLTPLDAVGLPQPFEIRR